MSRRLLCARGMLLAVALALAAAGCGHRARPPVIVAGDLHGELIWEGEVYVGGDVTLAAGSRLTIRPGTVVRFLPPQGFPGGASDHPYFPGSELNVAGVLAAVGTAESPIVFTAADDRAPPGSWGAVNFAENSSGTIRYCIFRQADSAVHSREATVEVSESLFERNLVAIRFHSSAIRIERNLLRDNETALRFHFGAPVVRANRFEGNRINLFISSHPRDYLFESNRFGWPHDYHVVLGEEVPEAVLLGNNDWGSTSPEALNGRFFDNRRSPYLGTVGIEPLRAVSAGEAGPSWMR